MRNEIQNFTHFSIGKNFVETLIQKTCEIERKDGTMRVSVSFVRKKRMEDLAEKYFKKDHEADVMSFEASKNVAFFSFSRETYLGEIIVCPFVVKEKARKQGVPFKRELAHVLIHGMLHLFGYRHEGDAKAAELMHEKEEIIMGHCGL